jgi:glutamyl-tRNA reductase
VSQIVATGLNHRTAPVELREKFAVPDASLESALQVLYALPGVREAVILSTCNRVELYTVEEGEGAPGHGSASFFRNFFQVNESVYISHLYRLYDEKAVRHLFSVASSLDSMIVGEPQILGQVKEYFLKAQIAGTTGRILNNVFGRALAVGKRTRTETAIGEMAVSVPYAAVELAKKVFDSLQGKTVGLLGRGKMSEITARHLKRSGVENLYVINRDMEHAIEFAKLVGGVPLGWSEDYEFLMHTDILICSTRASHPLITLEPLQKIMARRRNRMLFLIDISVPRRIDPAVNELENVYLFNIDHLEKMVAENMRLRMDEGRKAAAMIDDEVMAFQQWLGALDVVPAIRAFRERLESLRADEISRVLRNYEGFAPEQRELIEQFSKALINKIGHLPTTKLKSAADPDKAMRYSDILRDLFDLEKQDK